MPVGVGGLTPPQARYRSTPSHHVTAGTKAGTVHDQPSSAAATLAHLSSRLAPAQPAHDHSDVDDGADSNENQDQHYPPWRADRTDPDRTDDGEDSADTGQYEPETERTQRRCRAAYPPQRIVVIRKPCRRVPPSTVAAAVGTLLVARHRSLSMEYVD